MSTAIGTNLSRQIKSDFDRLLGRGHSAFPCPIGQGDRRKFWHNLFKPDIVAAYDLLESEDFNTSNMTEHYARFVLHRPDEAKFHVTFYSENQELLRFPDRKYGEAITVGESRLRSAFPGTEADWAAFTQWVGNCSVVHREFKSALKTFGEVLEMVGTVGQLVRAIPEVQSHLPGKAKQAMMGAKRASNMPFEWAIFDRTRIGGVQMAMCKAFLLPDAPGTTAWSSFDETWAKEWHA